MGPEFSTGKPMDNLLKENEHREGDFGQGENSAILTEGQLGYVILLFANSRACRNSLQSFSNDSVVKNMAISMCFRR